MRLFLQRTFWPAVYIALVVVFAVFVAKFHHPVFGFTEFFQLDATQETVMLPVLKERPVYVNHVTGGYDGLYYAQLATSPSLRDPRLPAAMDNFNYRAHRILGSAIAYVAGFGNVFRALDAYALLNPLCWLGLAVLLCFVFPPRSLHDALAWAGILFSAGALGSVRWALTDLPALLLVTAGVLAAQRQHFGRAAALVAAAGLARETALLAGLAIKGRTLSQNVQRALIVIAPAALWWIYVQNVAPPSSPHGLGNLGTPGVAYLGKWRECFAAFGSDANSAVPWLMLACLVGITVQSAWTLFRPAWENIWWRVAVGQVALMLCFGHAPWGGYPDAAARVLLPLHVAFNALIPRSRVGLAVLVLGNIGFVSGVDLILTRHPDPHEIAAARFGDAGYVATTAEGWYDIEGRGARAWCWSKGRSTLHVSAWHQANSAPIHLAFTLNGFVPGNVTITSGERIVWSGTVPTGKTSVEFALGELPPTGADFVFSSEATGKRESVVEYARVLTFAISEVRFQRLPR
jgi:hypothetical protein